MSILKEKTSILFAHIRTCICIKYLWHDKQETDNTVCLQRDDQRLGENI